SQVRNRDRTADDERHVEGVEKLFSIYSNRGALLDVISDAVVAAKHGRRHQAHQFFCSFVERAVFVSLCIKREEAFDAEVITAEQFLVHRRAIAVKLIHCVRLSSEVELSLYDPCASVQIGG